MSKHLQINIPEPCSQNWDEMTPDHAGRFCAHCQKTVIDFTSYSDTALYQFFSKNRMPVCGHFLSTQLDRPIHIPYQPHSQLYRIAIAFGMTLIFTQTPQLLAQNRPPKTEQTSLLKQTVLTGEVVGRVLDEKKEVLAEVEIRLYQNDSLRGMNTTDIDGNYSINYLDAGFYDLIAQKSGFSATKITGILVSPGVQIRVNINFQKSFVENPPIIIKTYRKPLVDGGVQTHIVTGEKRTSTFPRQENPYIEPLSDSTTSILLQDIQTKQQQMQPDQNNPTKRTFTREEINQMPH